jgi:OPA family glycerol-3-phosphate transporter-like MFS transporter
MSFWHVAHNIGAFLVGPVAIYAIAWSGDWHSILYAHGFLALAIVVLILFTVRDTPQSQGLPSIEDYNQDYPIAFSYNSSHEDEFSTKDIFFKYVLTNKLLWAIAIANAFVYLVRYGVLDWAPTYLRAEKGFTFDESSWAYSFYELAGIPGTIVCGFLSDKMFQGRRAPAVIIFMILTTICIVVYWLNPSGQPGIDIAMLTCIGFLIYGPVMLIGVFALDLVPKKAAGTAAGFTGLFGYIGGSLTASIFIPWIVEFYDDNDDNWDAGFLVIIAACVMAIIITAFTIKAEMRSIAAA